MTSMQEIGRQVQENSPFSHTRVGELAVGYTRVKTESDILAEMKATKKSRAEINIEGNVVRAMNDVELTRAFPEGQTHRQLLGETFTVTEYPSIPAYGAPAEVLLKRYPGIELDEGTRTILFGREQGAFTPYADNGNTPTAEG